MMRYCLVKVETRDGKATGLFCARRPTRFAFEIAWVPSLDDPGIIWYDTAEEANSNLLVENECVIAFDDGEEIECETDGQRPFKGKFSDPVAGVPLPPHGKGSKYDMEIRKFIDSGEKTRAVKENFGVTHTTVVRGLKRYADLFNYPVEVLDRFGTVYLVRKDRKRTPERRRFTCVGIFS